MLQPPKVDRRTAEDLAQQVRSLSPEAAGEDNNLAAALINVFARFGEIVIERINKAPHKNLLAFLDLLGISHLPPQAAQAPLTFYASEGSPAYVPVPLRTQVAATPAKDENQPVVFETAYELVVTSARLESLLAIDSARDEYIVLDPVLTPAEQVPSSAGTAGSPAAQAELQVEVRLLPHILYIGLKTYPQWPKINQVSLRFAITGDASGARDVRIVRWEIGALPPAPSKPATQTPVVQISDPVVWSELDPFRDDTDNLTKSGEVVFLNVPELPTLELEGTVTHWLRCRLLTAITREHEPALGMVRHTHLPRIESVEERIRLDRKGMAVDQAFANQVKVDITKDFFPFGEKPKFGDVLYLASQQVFSSPDALVTLHITLTNPASGTAQGLPPAAPNNIKLRWEYWDGQSWAELGISELSRRVRISQEPADGSAETEFSDATQTLSQSGAVSFRFSRPPREYVVNGQKNFWIRVRLIDGDYGKDVHYERDPVKGYVAMPATFAPPSIRSITIDYTVDQDEKAESLVTYNNFSYTRVATEGAPFQPFIPAPADHAVYFGFDAPLSRPALRSAVQSGKSSAEGTIFPNRSMSIYVSLRESEESQGTFNPAVWQYWNGSAWTKWTVRDDTQGLRRTGLIRFLAPSDYAARKEFGLDKYWLRMALDPSRPLPALRRVLLNTTLATQVVSFSNEILGTSNGKLRQKFYVLHAPILEGQRLEVHELAEPPLHEQKRIRDEEGDNAITKVAKTSGKGEEVWVCWHEAPNFYASSPRDRHYLLDRLTGEVRFGDGVNGLIPPAAAANIRMTSYKSGGGNAGNKAAGTITQLKSAVPYVARVFNWEPASGGADAETEAAMLERGTRVLRHGGRAVTAEDFEDLALLASPGVARAKCIPNHNLLEDPNCRHRRPGFVSVVVVPRSADPMPTPDAALFSTVRSFLNECCAPTLAGIALLGPVYVTLDVNTEIVVDDVDAAGDVELAATLAILRFLHPLTGGRDGAGWDFGARPHRSDFYAILEPIPGVSYVRNLELVINGGRRETALTGWSLICCGHSKITTAMEE